MKKLLTGNYLYPAALILIFGVGYLRTLAPTIWFGDSAEFQVIAHLGGLGHTTGYPLYLTLAKPFSFFPIGNPALNLNFMSALFGIGTVLLVYKVIHALIDNRLISFLSALLFGFGFTFWSQTSLAEVYTLHNFLFALSLLFILKWHKSASIEYLMLSLFIIALGLGNHLTILLILPPLAILMILNFKSHLQPNLASNIYRIIWPPATGLAIVVLLYFIHDATASPYDHLRAIEMMTPESWGKTAADFDSFWERMIHLATARQFSGSMFNIGWDELSERSTTAIGFIKYNIGLIGFLTGLVGLIWLTVRKWKLVIFFASLIFCAVIYNLNYGIWKFDISVYFIPVWMILAVMTGYLLKQLLIVTDNFFHRSYLKTVGVIIFMAVILLPLFIGSPQAEAFIDGHPPGIPDPYLAYNSTRPVMSQFEDDAIIFCLWHQFHVMGYILLIEDNRAGIALHEMFPAGEEYGFFPGYLNYINANIDHRPIYLTYPIDELERRYRFERRPPLIRLRRYDDR